MLLTIRVLRGLLLVAIACLVAGSGCRKASETRPNIILMVVDTLRADYLGSYGFQGPISPNLDRLASESVVFERCFSQSPWTKPSIASLFTSLYPQVHGVVDFDSNYPDRPGEALRTRTGVLPDRAVTLAEALRDGGYRTAAFVSNIWLLNKFGYGQGFELYHDHPAEARMTRADVLTDATRVWLALRASEEPYFLYLHFMDVHAPYVVTPKKDYDRLISKVEAAGEKRRLTQQGLPFVRRPRIENRPRWATDEMRRSVAYWQARYASGVQVLDRRLGSFLDFLRQEGHLEDSLLIVTSDHGEQLFEHGGWSHGETLYDHQLHTPLIVRLPGGRGGGRRIGDIAELVDLMPTLLSVARVPAPAGLQGRDLSALLYGWQAETPEATFATATNRAPAMHSVRTAEHKYIVDLDTGDAFLADLAASPNEQHNVFTEQPKLAARLHRRLQRHLETSLANGALDVETGTVSDDQRAQLEALGYLGGGAAEPKPAPPPAAPQASRLAALKQAAERNPSVSTYLNLSLRAFDEGELETSLWAAGKALELDPDNARAHNNLCVTYGKLERWQAAISACRKALAIDPDLKLASNNLSWVKSRQKTSGSGR